MKRLICMLLIVFCLPGCAQPQEDTCRFYYLRTSETIQYGREDALIAPVTRNISDQDAQLDYLLQLYLEGPTEEGFRSPLPPSTYLLSFLWEEDTLVLVFSREFSALENMELTLAGACLTATCRDLTGAEQLKIHSGDNTYEFDWKDYTFLDQSTGQ